MLFATKPLSMSHQAWANLCSFDTKEDLAYLAKSAPTKRSILLHFNNSDFPLPLSPKTACTSPSVEVKCGKLSKSFPFDATVKFSIEISSRTLNKVTFLA